jgi:F420-dependent oxidoreductase-like protein
MRFGLQLPRVTRPGLSGHDYFEHLVELCAVAEFAGFDSVWIGDHLLHGNPDDTDPLPDALTLLAGLASCTGRMQLGALVAPVTFRPPALAAKIVTTLDAISGGRAVMGLGAGWNAEEHRRYGISFPPLRERMERLEDAAAIARTMFDEAVPTYRGRHHSVEAALNHPRPQRGSIPIVIGGNGERRTLRIAARYADACNLTVADPQLVRRKLAVLDRHCEELGRDPATVARTRGGGLVIAPTHEQARRDAETLRSTIGLTPERFAGWAVVGTPDEVRHEVQAGFDAGLDGFMFYLGDSPDGEPIARAGELLRSTFG